MAYRLLAVDLDDTLLDKNLRVSEGNRRALWLAREAGVVVTLATGRMFRATLPFARELGIEAPLIVYQGALVKHAASGEVVAHRPVPLDLAVDVVGRLAAKGFHVNVYLDDCLYVEKTGPESALYESISRVSAVPVGKLVPFLRARGQDPTKVLAVGKEEELDRLAQEMRALYGESLHITKSKPFFLEFSHPLANKGRALADVAAYYGFAPQEVIAVGDAENDLEMIAWAGLGVAVANARPQVLASADYVTASHEEDGVARVVEKFILGREGVR